MRSIRAAFLRFAGLFHKQRRDAEFALEMQSHLEMQTEDYMRAGMVLAEARRLALLQAGGLESAKEAYRDRRGLPFVETMLQDFRYALRMLRKGPGFAAVVALTLALGIGANTAIFSVIHAVLAPMAVPDPDRAVMVWTENLKRGWHQFPVSAPDYLDWKMSGVFSSLGAFKEAGYNLRFADRTERIEGFRVTPEVFQVLAPTLQLGRLFRGDDQRAGHDQVAILTDDLWRSRFAADPEVIGRSIILNGAPHSVIGILPQRFPRFGREQIFTPLIFTPPLDTSRGTRSFEVIGRLQDGVSWAAARKRMTELSQHLARQFPDDAGNTSSLQPLAEAYVEDARALLLVLFGAVGLVLLIACANIANLLLARGTGRTREMAIRAALGAGQWRLCRQLLAENVLLALLGGLLALVPALWGIDFIASFHLDEIPNAALVKLNASVLLFNFALALGTGLLCGLVPAWQAWKNDVNNTLQATSRAQAGRMQQRLRGLFVVSEVALTLVLLVAAGLILRSFLRMRGAYPGYTAQGVLTMRIALSDRQYAAPEKQAAFYEQVIAQARALPGVVSAAAADELPTTDEIHGAALLFPDRPEPRTEDIPIVLQDSVTPDYFRTMWVPLRRGRYPAEADRREARRVAVLDEWTAKRYWPNQDAVGRFLKLGRKQPPLEIVGVVGNVDQSLMIRLLKGRVGQVYVPLAQEPRPTMTLVLRTVGDPAASISAVRGVVRRVDIDQPVFRVETMEAVRAAGRKSQQLAACLLAGFALVALLLAAIGLYGVMAYHVGQRTREFGIRMSLGAQRRNVLALVVRQGMMLTAAGMLLGLAGALAVTRLLESLLYGIEATDLSTFAGVTALLAAVALVASYIPARRATEVAPALALRCD